ncbi:MarR family transcriptional regulator [Nocardioides sp. C4-1]|uniref:MarR family winged helix-turn-helix transcriptional regulator n=1 Tax=Nocardioides sp. C4-1 TaxID=3151851 RepID=UPI003263D738
MGHPDTTGRNLVREGVVDSRELLPALAELPGHVLWRAHARVALALAEELPDGVDIHAYAVLLALAEADVPRSQQSLADTVSVSRTTLARVAADLSARGLVERVRNPDDRRSYALTRTDAGAAAASDWRQHADAVQERLLAPFDAAEGAELVDLLHRLVDAEIAPDAPSVLRGSIGFLVSRAHASLYREFQVGLDPLDLEPRLFGALTAIATAGPLAQADLARLLGVSGPRVVQIADALEARGLVERRRDPADRRARLLHLQPGAEEVLARARAVADDLNQHLGPLGVRDTRRLGALLRTFVTA